MAVAISSSVANSLRTILQSPSEDSGRWPRCRARSARSFHKMQYPYIRILSIETMQMWAGLDSSYSSAVQPARSCYDQPTNPMTFPAPVPEIPAASVGKAAAYYVGTEGIDHC